MLPEARWPNTGPDLMLPNLAGGSVNHITGLQAQVVNPDIPDLPEGWAGATVWANEWFVSRTGTITGGSGGILDAIMTAEWPRNAYWFYLTGKLGLLDAPGEWFYDGNAGTLYLWAPDGGPPSQVEVKQRTFAFDLTDRSHIVIQDLALFASTITTSDISEGIILDRLDVRYLSHHVTLPPLPLSEQAPGSDGLLIVASHAHDTGIQLRGSNHILRNSTIGFSSGNGVLLEGSGHLVDRNLIHDVNYQSTYASGVRLNGSNHRVLRNTLTRSGRDLVTGDFHTCGYSLTGMEIAWNDVSAFGALSSDLGAFYFASAVDMTGSRIHHNTFHDPYGYSFFWDVAGIYTDNDTFNATVDHNVFYDFNISIPKGLKISSKPALGTERVYHNTSLIFDNLPLTSGDLRNNLFLGIDGFSGEGAANNLFADTDPLFTNAANADFTLQPGSPAIDQGALIPGINDEFTGAAPDIGAFESGLPPWTSGVNSTHQLSAPPTILTEPQVTAQPVTLPGAGQLHVNAEDPDGSPIRYLWRKMRGPGTVTITPNGTIDSDNATANFSTYGYYELEVEITDGHDSVVAILPIHVAAGEETPLQEPPGPESLWPAQWQANDSGPEGSFYELGTRFTPLVDGMVTHLRVYALPTETGLHTARLWHDATGTIIAGPFEWDYAGATGWITLDIPDVELAAGESYTIAVSTGQGARHYPIILWAASEPGDNGSNLTYPVSSGVYSTTAGTRPTESFRGSVYLRDIVFVPRDLTTGFPGWASRQGLPDDGQGLGATDAAPAGDAVPNLIKYALDLEAWTPGVGDRLRWDIWQPAPGPTQPRCLSLESLFPDPAPEDLLYTPRSSPNLLDWTGALQEVSRVSEGNGFQRVRWRDAVSLDDANRRFIRFQTQRLPSP